MKYKAVTVLSIFFDFIFIVDAQYYSSMHAFNCLNNPFPAKFFKSQNHYFLTKNNKKLQIFD